MEQNDHPIEDEFHSPQPHSAAAKATVNAVIDRVANMGTSVLSLLTGLLAAVLMLYSGYVLYDTFYTQAQAASSSWDLLQYRPQIMEDGAEPTSGENALSAINEDYRAWLTVYDTNLDYPVMQGPDDLYYASHDIYKQVSLTGAIYLAAGNTVDLSDTYNLIYGHHMDNGAMFGALDLYDSEEYFRAHREGILVGKSAVYDLYAFAACRTDAYENEIYNVGNRMDEVLTYLQNPTETTSVLYYDAEAVQGAERIVALSTCASAETNGRFVLFCRMNQRSLIKVTAEGYDGTFDNLPHTLTWTTNYPDGTTVEFSTNGEDWTTEAPTITNVGTIPVTVRVTHPTYGRAAVTVNLTVRPKPLTVRANPAEKMFGTPDPTLSAVVIGLTDNETITYTIARQHTEGEPAPEAAGTYPGTIIPSGEALQGNYSITYLPATFTITPSDQLRLTVGGHEGVYDGNIYTVTTNATVEDGTTITYSTDGVAWSAQAPTIRDVGSIHVFVRAENPNYITVTAETDLIMNPRPVTVQANPASKVYGASDPRFAATVTGLLGNDRINYTISRPGKGTDEDAGTYPDAIVPTGEQRQGNYAVTFVPAPFTITEAGALVLTAAGYEGVYDTKTHTVAASVNVPAGTTIEYSTDNGATWTRTAPQIRDVGTAQVLVRATNRNYETQQTAVTLQVTPASVTVRANDLTKIYGEDDPALTATVTGVLDDTEIVYTITRPSKGQDELPGEYADAIVPTGDAVQGNYAITYAPGTMRIVEALGLGLNVTGFDGVYDGQSHTVTATATHPTGGDVLIEYSTDGGETFGTEPPSRRDVGSDTVLVRVSAPGYRTVETTVQLNVTPRHVLIAAANASKLAGDPDPDWEITVTGVLEGEEALVLYTVEREPGEERGSYAIMPTGETEQGNYTVEYVFAKLVIIGEVSEPEEPKPIVPTITEPDDDNPIFRPRGGGKPAWALVNLIAMILTVYLLIPLLHLKAKYGRGKAMEKVNEMKETLRERIPEDSYAVKEKARIETRIRELREKQQKKMEDFATEIGADEFRKSVETLYYRLKKFRRKFRIGIVLEVFVAVGAVVAFILTEDMRLPMVLIDRWTPLMLILLAGIWVIDFILIRYRDQVEAEEMDKQEQQKQN